MAGTINGAKADASQLMKYLAARLGTQRFGVAGFSDYVDIPYGLYQPLTNDVDAVQAAIDSLELVDGGDIPEAYSRMMFEVYSDPAIGWNSDARRYLIIFGDSIPHDPDAGHDGILGTPDDLDLDEVLSQLAAHDITLIFVSAPGVYGDSELIAQWQDWTESANGSVIQCSNP